MAALWRRFLVPRLLTVRRFSEAPPKPLPKKHVITVHYITRDGTRYPARAAVGENLLDAANNNNLELDGFGACEGTLSCSTCHLIFKKPDFDRLADKPTDEELDMLDLAYGLTDTSRLGCQVCLTKEMDGIEIEVPAFVSDARNS